MADAGLKCHESGKVCVCVCVCVRRETSTVGRKEEKRRGERKEEMEEDREEAVRELAKEILCYRGSRRGKWDRKRDAKRLSHQQ